MELSNGATKGKPQRERIPLRHRIKSFDSKHSPQTLKEGKMNLQLNQKPANKSDSSHSSQIPQASIIDSDSFFNVRVPKISYSCCAVVCDGVVGVWELRAFI